MKSREIKENIWKMSKLIIWSVNGNAFKQQFVQYKKKTGKMENYERNNLKDIVRIQCTHISNKTVLVSCDKNTHAVMTSFKKHRKGIVTNESKYF